MCGLTGILHSDGAPVHTAMLAAMTRALVHRGPDDEGLWVDGPVGLGHRRLSIRDLSIAGRQPMTDPSGSIVLAFNGEIYNDGALREELARLTGWTFRTRTDTETLLAGWLAWGEGVLDRIEGMFALAVWDRRDRSLWLARDPAGIKPLFLARKSRRVAFASEVKGLWPALDPRPALSPQALHSFLAQGYTGPASTLLDGVEQVPPGHVLSCKDGTWRDRQYWQPIRRSDIRSLDDAVEGFLEIWRDVLPSLLISDVPVGVLQSGGIDSSLVTLSLSGRERLPAFVASFAEESHDETTLARQVAQAAGAELHTIPVDIERNAEATFRAVVHSFDGQVTDASAFAAYRLCAEVRKHVTVVLSGDGADEFFGGYDTYRATRLAGRLHPWVPKAIAGALGRVLASGGGGDERRLPPRQIAARFLLGLAGRTPHCQWRRHLPAYALPSLYGTGLIPLLGIDPLANYGAAFAAGGGGDDGALLSDQSHYLPADMLMKMDACSMAHGLEVRVPFLTRAVMDLAGRIDSAILQPPGGPPKAPLRAALARLGAPDTVVSGRKRGFNVPIDRLLRGPLHGLASRLLDAEAGRLAPWLDPDAVRRMWHGHRDKHYAAGYSLWTLLSLAEWLEQIECR